MLTQGNLVDIHTLHSQGNGIRAIAKALGVSRNTVRRYLRDKEKMPVYQREQRRVSVKAIKAYLRQRIEAAKPGWIPATVLLREIQGRGYQGKDGIL